MTIGWKSRRSLASWAGIVLLGAFSTMSIWAIAQCDQLHAGLRTNLTQPTPVDKPDHLQLTFALINDSDKVIPVDKSKWELIIDGTEVKEFDLSLGVGASATDNSLAPGQWYEFSRLIPLSDHFPTAGEHTVQWTGEGFRSPKISFSLPNEHAGQ
jgi:hypothetical protein